MHYEKKGSGKTILLLHGWGDRSDTFKSLLPVLSGGYTVISLDLPGFGQSESPKEIWNLDNYAKFVASFLNKTSNTQLHAIIGHSNGGALAIRGIAKGDLNPSKLVLLAASGVRDTEKIRRFIIKIVAKTGKILTFWLPEQYKKKLQKKLYGTVGSDMLVAPQLQETFKKTVRQDIQKDAAKLSVPTLLIYGDQDTATPIKNVGSRLHELIKDSQLQIITGADHFVHQTSEPATAAYIQEFLTK